jgi:hypothetical protein
MNGHETMSSTAKSSKAAPRMWPMIVYIALMAIGIPWYWPSSDYSIIFGMPQWVVMAIGVSFVASAFTAWLLRQPWPGELDQQRLTSAASDDEAD